MVFDYSPQEQEQLEKIRQKYQKLILESVKKAESANTEELKKQLDSERRNYQLQLNEELESFTNHCEQKRFAEIENTPAAILENAKEQIPQILNHFYNDLAGTKFEIIDGVTIKKKNKMLLLANFATGLIIDELKLHREALEKDAESLQKLYSLIINGVETSDLTTDENIDIETMLLSSKIMRYRRNSLTDISYYGLMSDKATAQIIRDGIFKEKPNGQMMVRWAVNQAPKGKEEVPVYIALSYEGTENKLSKRLTAFDNAVYNAVSTRYYYWKLEHPEQPLYITPQEVWKTMNGKSSSDRNAKPSKAQAQRICDSLDKMRFTRFIMDITAEIKAYKLFIDDERVEGGMIDCYLLNSNKLEFETEKGRTVTGYRIGEEPILYTYNQAKKHILYVPFKMLDTSNHTSDSENVTEFKNYLLQQIQLMKNANESDKKGKFFKRNNRILIDSIYADTGIKTPEERAEESTAKTEDTKNSFLRKTRKKDREKIEGLLQSWTTEKWIKGYEAIKDGQTIRGYDIIL